MDDQQQSPQQPQQLSQQVPQQQDLQHQLADLRQMLSDQQQLLDDLRRHNQEQLHIQPEIIPLAPGSTTVAANHTAQEVLIRDLNARLNAHYIQVDIDHYDHPAISGDREKWMTRFETLTNEVGWKDARRACCIPSYLSNQAKKWFNHCQHNEWPDIRQAFVAHFRTLFCERTEYEALKYDSREPIGKFIEIKEEKAIAAGIPENQAIEHLIINADLPFDYAINLAAQTIPTFADLKRAVNKMTMVRDRRSRHPIPTYANATQDSSFAYERSSRHSPYSRHPTYTRPSTFTRPSQPRSARYGGRPPICPECKRRGFERHHWLSDCFFRQQTVSTNTRAPTTSNHRPAINVNRPHTQNRSVNVLEIGDNADIQQQPANPN